MKGSVATVWAAQESFVRRTLASLGVPHVDVDDVAQEVACGIARGVPSFAATLERTYAEALRSWVYRICELQAASYARARWRQLRLETVWSASLDGVIDERPDPEECLARGEQAAFLHRLLDVLTAERRAVFVAYELEGREMRDVAGTLGILVNTAWNRYRLAREDLRAAWRRRERSRGAPGVRLT